MDLNPLENTLLTHALDTLRGWLDALETIVFHIGKTELNLYLVAKGLLVLLLLQWLARIMLHRADTRLRRTSIRASNRTLIIKFLSIALYFTIFLFGLQLLGISLAAFSVLGGALGVGIGFGLQKIASNFISGIILLFEKSVEVDDMIQLADGTTGFVRQTYARYTLLEGPDGREILIPNEEFITQRVTSLTHSDSLARIDIAVTVAYDADLEKALRIMTDCAKANALSVPEREPAAFVTDFADSGIALLLYFWVPDVTEGRLTPKSDVMIAIHKTFKANGIAIPFPQREVRLLNEPAPEAKARSTAPKPKAKAKP